MDDGLKALGSIAFLVVVVILALMFGLPKYWVWQQARSGEAELKRAEFNRQVAVEEAHAKMQSAKMLAQSEVERAKGVAEANKIIGDSLQGNESYLRYLWIQGISTGGNREVVYVPTEANLPILEASRLAPVPAEASEK